MEKVEKDQLDLDHEVYVDWSYEFVHWHNQLFQGRQPKLALSIMNQLKFFLRKRDSWAGSQCSCRTSGRRRDKEVAGGFKVPPRVINYMCMVAGSRKIQHTVPAPGAFRNGTGGV